jgi:prepilin-type N-terminal cleavage/methylation domain-containing protein
MRTRRRRPAFTLLEMLVVVGIIVLLVSILLPVVGSVRKTAYQTRSAALVAKLATAINNYYNDFKAYPGPLGDDQIDTTPITPPIQGLSVKVTGSENLVLGLLGGLKIQATNGAIAYDPMLVGKGPASLNQINPKLYSPYIDFVPSELSPSTGTGNSLQYQQVNQTSSNPDSPVPEFMDSFPDPDTRPIIYMRARVGAPSSPQGSGNQKTQYNPKDPIPYFVSVPMHPERFEGVNDFPLKNDEGGMVTFYDWIANPSLQQPSGSGSGSSPNGPEVRGKDRFILIQAGKDRKFGTSDDYFYP